MAEHATAVELWLLRGDFIQLGDEPSPAFPLETALRSYQRAAELDPGNAEAQFEIGHYMAAVLDDPPAALPFFRAAIELGGVESAERAFASALEQLEG